MEQPHDNPMPGYVKVSYSTTPWIGFGTTKERHLPEEKAREIAEVIEKYGV